MSADDLATGDARTGYGSGARVITKRPIDVELVFGDGSTLSGVLYVSHSERISDVLNDPRPFLPFHTDEGEFLLIQKTSIAMCKPLDIAG